MSPPPFFFWLGHKKVGHTYTNFRKCVPPPCWATFCTYIQKSPKMSPFLVAHLTGENVYITDLSPKGEFLRTPWVGPIGWVAIFTLYYFWEKNLPPLRPTRKWPFYWVVGWAVFFFSYVKNRLPCVKKNQFPCVKMRTCTWKNVQKCPWKINSLREIFSKFTYVKIWRSVREKNDKFLTWKLSTLTWKKKRDEICRILQ